MPHSAPSWILSQAENLASSSLQDGATEWCYSLAWTIHSPQLSFFVNVVRCPHPNKVCAVYPPLSKCFLSKLCGVPTPFVPLIKNVCAVSPPCNSVPLPHFALSWILSKVENLARWSHRLVFFSVLLGPSLNINLAQLVSPSVAIPAELVFTHDSYGPKKCLTRNF